MMRPRLRITTALSAMGLPTGGRRGANMATRTKSVAALLWKAQDGLDALPADGTNWAGRRRFLLEMDAALRGRHGRAWKRAVGAHFQRQMNKALDEIASARVERGVRIWRMYNMGFVVKSPKATIGFDIHPGWVFRPPMTASQQGRLANLLDAAFVSHWHPDHLSRGILGQMNAAGKMLVASPTFVLGLRLRGDNVVRLRNTRGEPVKVAALDVWCYPGWQSWFARNNIYVVDMGGTLVMHQGENTMRSPYAAILRRHKIDVLLAKSRQDLARSVNGVKPNLLITSHEHELMHVWRPNRNFGRSFTQLDKMGVAPPWAPGATQGRILSWGEQTRWP